HAEPELAELPFGVLVAAGRDTDHRDPGLAQPGEHVAVQPAQAGRDQRRPGQPGLGGSEQVGDVDAAADDGERPVAAAQRGDELGLRPGVGDRGDDREAHGLSDDVGSAELPSGSRTRSTSPCLEPLIRAATWSGGTASTTPTWEVAEPSPRLVSPTLVTDAAETASSAGGGSSPDRAFGVTYTSTRLPADSCAGSRSRGTVTVTRRRSPAAPGPRTAADGTSSPSPTALVRVYPTGAVSAARYLSVTSS